MGMQGIIHANSYQRTTSSGMVFDGKLPVKGKSDNTSHLNGILFRLIEEEFELTIRSQNCLNNAGIKLIGQLVQKSIPELLALKNYGRKSLIEIEEILSGIGLNLCISLNFPPWNVDGYGTDLVHILTRQRIGGGFHMDNRVAKSIGINLEKVKMAAHQLPKNIAADNFLILSTSLILDHLQERYEKRDFYLSGIIQRNQKWMKKELRQDATGIFFNQLNLLLKNIILGGESWLHSFLRSESHFLNIPITPLQYPVQIISAWLNKFMRGLGRKPSQPILSLPQEEF